MRRVPATGNPSIVNIVLLCLRGQVTPREKEDGNTQQEQVPAQPSVRTPDVCSQYPQGALRYNDIEQVTASC